MTIRFELTLTIDRPRADVWALFTDRTQQQKWQATLQRVALLHGEPFTEGAVSDAVYLEGGRRIVMRETVVALEPLSRVDFSYVAAVADSIIENRFVEEGPERTVWRCAVTLAPKGFARILAPLMKPLAARKTLADMRRFKALAQREVPV